MRGKALSLHRFEVCWATERKPVTCYDYQSTPHWIRCWPCFRSYLRKQGRNDASCRAVMVDHVSKNLSVSSFSTTFQIVESNSVTEPGCPFFFLFFEGCWHSRMYIWQLSAWLGQPSQHYCQKYQYLLTRLPAMSQHLVSTWAGFLELWQSS